MVVVLDLAAAVAGATTADVAVSAVAAVDPECNFQVPVATDTCEVDGDNPHFKETILEE